MSWGFVSVQECTLEKQDANGRSFSIGLLTIVFLLHRVCSQKMISHKCQETSPWKGNVTVLCWSMIDTISFCRQQGILCTTEYICFFYSFIKQDSTIMEPGFAFGTETHCFPGK